jgi:hypothetical protein
VPVALWQRRSVVGLAGRFVCPKMNCVRARGSQEWRPAGARLQNADPNEAPAHLVERAPFLAASRRRQMDGSESGSLGEFRFEPASLPPLCSRPAGGAAALAGRAAVHARGPNRRGAGMRSSRILKIVGPPSPLPKWPDRRNQCRRRRRAPDTSLHVDQSAGREQRRRLEMGETDAKQTAAVANVRARRGRDDWRSPLCGGGGR